MTATNVKSINTDTNTDNPKATKAEADRLFRSGKFSAVAEVYANAYKEGVKKGRSVARKSLMSQFGDMTPEQIVLEALKGA